MGSPLLVPALGDAALVTALEAASQALALTDPWFPYRLNREAVSLPEIALAGLARCRRLLSGMIRLDDAPDLTGAFARTLFETWLAAVYLLLGGDDAHARLEADDAQQQRRIAKRLLRDARSGAPVMELSDRLRSQAEAVLAQDPPTVEGINVADMTIAVRRLLIAEGDPNFHFPESAYAVLYGPQSYTAIHGGLGAMKQHILVRGQPGDAVRAVPDDDVGRERRLDLSTAMVVVLARRVAMVLAVPGGALDAFVETWLARVRSSD